MKITVEQFEGPLDLLLKLIEEEKLDITKISLAKVTEQFLNYMRSLDNMRPQQLSDWLSVAAKLLVIKSKTLMPTLDLSEDEEEDATSLAWQLYQYKRYKEAAKMLAEMQNKNQQSWNHGSKGYVQQINFYPDPNVNTATLHSTMKYIAKTLEKIESIPKKVLEEVVTISDKIDELQHTLGEKIETGLAELLQNASSKTEVIVTFLALLELVKQRILTVDQEAMFSDIVIRKTNG